MPEVIGGSASSRGEWVPPAGNQLAGDNRVLGPAAGELVVLLECNRKQCRRSWVLRAGQQIPGNCPGCGKFDW